MKQVLFESKTAVYTDNSITGIEVTNGSINAEIQFFAEKISIINHSKKSVHTFSRVNEDGTEIDDELLKRLISAFDADIIVPYWAISMARKAYKEIHSKNIEVK